VEKNPLSSANKNNVLPPSPASTVKVGSKVADIEEEDILAGKVSSESTSMVRTVKRKESSDAIKMVSRRWNKICVLQEVPLRGIDYCSVTTENILLPIYLQFFL
jgi:hypothetical protein